MKMTTILDAIRSAPYAFPLISVHKNIGGPASNRVITNNDFTSQEMQKSPFVVRKETLHGGRQEGVEVVDIYNGRITIRAVPTRGMEIWDVRDNETGIRFGMNSPVSSEIVHPQYMDAHGYGGLGWALNGFGAFFNRCGLHSASNPGPDTVVTNTGDRREIYLPLHGEINRIPASEVWFTADTNPFLSLLAQVKEWKMFGQKLTLESELITTLGAHSFSLIETVRNDGTKPTEMMTMFHINVGEPVLDDGAEFVADFTEIEPRDKFAGEGNWRENVHKFGPSVPGYVEKVYYGKLATDPYNSSRRSHALLKNSRGDLGVSISYAQESNWSGVRG